MSLFDELSEFIGSTVVPREIETKGKKTTVYFKELSADAAEEFFAAVDKDQKKNKGLRNRLLALTVVNKDGSAGLTAEQAGKLPNELANKLQDAALEVNGLNKAAQEEAKKE